MARRSKSVAEWAAIEKGMAEALWESVSGKWRDVPDAAAKAAGDLAALYENMNDESLSVMRKNFNRKIRKLENATYPEFSFGRMLALGAMERTGDKEPQSSHRHQLTAHGIAVPYFLVMLSKSELVWEGGTEDSPGKLFGRRERVNPKDKDYTMRERGEFAGKESWSGEEVPHVKSLAEVRQLLARRTKKCHRDCPGWAIFETDRGLEIQVCDECEMSQASAVRLSDDDVAQLPEAQRALREAMAKELEENPRAVVRDRGGMPLAVGDKVLIPRDAGGGRGTVVKLHPGKSWDVVIEGDDGETYEGNGGRFQKIGAGRPPGVPNRSRR